MIKSNSVSVPSYQSKIFISCRTRIREEVSAPSAIVPHVRDLTVFVALCYYSYILNSKQKTTTFPKWITVLALSPFVKPKF